MELKDNVRILMETTNFTLGELINVVSDRYPDREAIVYQDIRKTWKEFNDDISDFSASLINLGIKLGDKVCLWSKNCYEWAVAWYALPKIGAILVPMDSWYTLYEAEYIISHSDAVAIITTSDFMNSLNKLGIGIKNIRYVILLDKTYNISVISSFEDYEVLGMINLIRKTNKEIYSKQIQERINNINKNDTTFILYTSGTTGKPKGAMLTHYGIIKNMMHTADTLNATPSDRYLIAVPFSHCFGCIVGITLATITASAIISLLDQNPKIAIDTIAKEKVSIIHGTPTHFIRYIREYKINKDKDISSLRTGIIAGAPCPPTTMTDIIQILGIKDIIIGYGETEASPFITMTKFDDDIWYRVNTVGKSLPELEVKIVDENNKELSIGQKGELCCKGYNVMIGYYKSRLATSNALDKDGFLHTGDLASIDENGYYSIIGRKKDMIIYGGVNVYPKIIEDFLLQHKDIKECAVVGVNDEEYGEVVAAIIKSENDLTAQNVVDYAYGEIQSPSVPRYVIMDIEFPLSGRGKIQKYKLREYLNDMKKNGFLGNKLIPTKVSNKAQYLDKSLQLHIKNERNYIKKFHISRN